MCKSCKEVVLRIVIDGQALNRIVVPKLINGRCERCYRKHD